MDTIKKYEEENDLFGKGTSQGKHIFNQKLFSQPVLFDGIGKGKCMPTDYDSVIELDNKYWFAFEVKRKGKSMPYGQSLSYTRTADKWDKCGDISYVFVVEHEETDPNKPILLKDCKLKKLYHKGEWLRPKKPLTVTETINVIKQKYNITKI